MYGSNGFYIRFTIVFGFGKWTFLPPRGPISDVFLRKFGLFPGPCQPYPVTTPVTPRFWSWSVPRSGPGPGPGPGHGPVFSGSYSYGSSLRSSYGSYRIVLYRIVCIRIRIRIRIRVRIRVRMAPRFARRTGDF